MPWIKRPASELDDGMWPEVWEHPSHAVYEKQIRSGAIPCPWTSEFTFSEGGGGLNGYKPPRLPRHPNYTHPGHAAWDRAWKAGKLVIPGFRVQIKTADGRELGPSEVKNGRIVPLTKVKLM